MFRYTGLFLKAVPSLTFVKADYKVLAPQLVSFLQVDVDEKKLDVPPYEKVPFAFDAKTADGKVAGSICGYSVWNLLHVDMFCASPDVKVPGMGKALMRRMEDMARELGKTRLELDTYSWQARPFYEKLGFKLYATQDDYPKGHNRFFMEKVWKRGDGYNAEPYKLAGTSEAAKTLTVVEADVKEAEVRLAKWLDDNTQSRKIPGVEPYVKHEFALEACLPDGSLGAGSCFETLWQDMHISLFACNPERKGRGIGSDFLEHLATVAREKGCHRMSLETMSWQAQPFYEKHGFKVFGTQKDVAADGHSRIFLQRRL